MSNKCTHETSVVKRMCTGFDVLRCTWECGEDVIKLIMDDRFHLVATFTASELVEVVKEHKALNTAMPCGHLARYAVQENNTQYCAICEAEKMTDTVLGMKAA